MRAPALPTRRPDRGTTIVDLIMTITINALIITAVYIIWTKINVTSLNAGRSEMFVSEAVATSRNLITPLQYSAGVLHWQANSVRFIRGNGRDTTTIESDGDSVRIDGRTVRMISEQARLKSLTIRCDDWIVTDTVDTVILLQLALRFDNRRGDTLTVPLLAAVPLLARIRDDGWLRLSAF